MIDSGAQGEYAGLRAIMAYLHANGEDQRTVSILSQFKQGALYEFSVTLGFEVLITVQYLNVFCLLFTHGELFSYLGVPYSNLCSWDKSRQRSDGRHEDSANQRR